SIRDFHVTVVQTCALPISNISSGIRCAETTRVSNGTSNSRNTAAACCITFQSLPEPMTMPTTASTAGAGTGSFPTDSSLIAARSCGGRRRRRRRRSSEILRDRGGTRVRIVGRKLLARQPAQRLAIACGGLLDDVPRKGRRGGLLVPAGNALEVVAHVLLVEGR